MPQLLRLRDCATYACSSWRPTRRSSLPAGAVAARTSCGNSHGYRSSCDWKEKSGQCDIRHMAYTVLAVWLGLASLVTLARKDSDVTNLKRQEEQQEE